MGARWEWWPINRRYEYFRSADLHDHRNLDYLRQYDIDHDCGTPDHAHRGGDLAAHRPRQT